MNLVKSAAFGFATIGLVGLALPVSAQGMMSSSMSSKDKMHSCMAMTSDAMMADSGCMAMMKKMHMSDADMKMMMSCKAMSHDAMMADKGCSAMMKKHPSMGKMMSSNPM